MSALDGRTCVVAALRPDGSSVLAEVDAQVRAVPSGKVETLWFWRTEGTPALPDACGEPVTGPGFPLPGGAKFGLVCLPPQSDGRLLQGGGAASVSSGVTSVDDAGMHATNSVDFEVVISGRLVLTIPGGQTRVLGPGDSVVMAGAPHAWSNPFDEPCVYAAVVLGASPSP